MCIDLAARKGKETDVWAHRSVSLSDKSMEVSDKSMKLSDKSVATSDKSVALSDNCDGRNDQFLWCCQAWELMRERTEPTGWKCTDTQTRA